MAKVRFQPLFENLRGTIKGMVFRLSHNGKISAYLSPDMSRVVWSQAQDAHRERMAEAWAYGSQAIRDPEIREIYVQMALEKKKDENRPRDMAVSDYFHNHNNLLGDRFQWDVQLYRWKMETRRERRRKKRR
jgi:hypothetical protein